MILNVSLLKLICTKQIGYAMVTKMVYNPCNSTISGNYDNIFVIGDFNKHLLGEVETNVENYYASKSNRGRRRSRSPLLDLEAY